MNKEAPREISYQMALWPSARVLRHCPDGRLHMRLRGKNRLEKRMMKSAICDSHETVKRAGDDQRAISVEVYSGDKVEVGVQCFGGSTCIESMVLSKFSRQEVTRTLCCIPYSHIAVTASGYELRPLSVVVDAEYVACMSFEDFTRQTLPYPRLSTKIVYSDKYIRNRHPIFEWCDHQTPWRDTRCLETMRYQTGPLCAHSNCE